MSLFYLRKKGQVLKTTVNQKCGSPYRDTGQWVFRFTEVTMRNNSVNLLQASSRLDTKKTL